MQKITPESTLQEAFDYYDAADQEGVQVIPLTIKQQSDDTRLAIFIKGEHQTASVIMAELMMKIEELFDMTQQAEASKPDNEPKSRIIT